LEKIYDIKSLSSKIFDDFWLYAQEVLLELEEIYALN